MNLDAVHEINSFDDQVVMPVVDENPPNNEAKFSYDELFPSLPENELKPEAPSMGMGQWTEKMKMRSQVITQVYRVPLEERKFKGLNSERFGEKGEQASICADIMRETEAHIEISSSKDQSLTILVTGSKEAVQKARNLILKKLQTQGSRTITIPRDHHRFILGKKGKRLTDLEASTATKITVPRPEKNSDQIEITGPADGIATAAHHIQEISDEMSKMAFERLPIPKTCHPFIMGPFNETLKMLQQNGAKINIPPPSVNKDELTVAGDKEAVTEALLKIQQIVDKVNKNGFVCIEVPRNQHRYIIGHRGQTLQEIFSATGVWVEMPPQDSTSDTITLRGEQGQLGPALTEVYAKATSNKSELLDVPSWLHKYVIGKKGANIKHTTQDLPKVQVDFIDEQIRVDGPTEEVSEAVKKLKDVIEQLQKDKAYAEIKVPSTLHRHIIGKNGSNITKLKEDTNTVINIPGDKEGDIVTIEGSPEGVEQVRTILQEMVQKQKNEDVKELNIEQRFHRYIIGSKGEAIREIKEKFKNQVNIAFPEPGLRSDKVTIRGQKAEVESCYKYLKEKSEKLKEENYTVDVPIFKQHHKFIIGKQGANIKKIRDETNTRIELPAEGADSEVIVIRGRKEDVHKAKSKIVALQNELENITTQEIKIPPNVHNALIGAKGRKIRAISEECGNVIIKFPNSGTGSDKVEIRGPKDDVMKAKRLLLELSEEKQSMGHTEELKCKPSLHKFLIGKNGSTIKRVRDETNAKIVFPSSSDDDNESITIIGRKEEVTAAKKMMEKLISEFENTCEMKVNVDPKHHRHFVAKGALILKQIGYDFDGVSISFPKKDSDSPEVTLKGLKKESLEGAKQRLLDIVEDLESQVEQELVVPHEHHRTMVGKGGSKVQMVQDQHRVSIKFPDVDRNGPRGGGGDYQNADMVNGDAHSEEKPDLAKDTIIIRGKVEDCEAAKEALRALIPTTIEVEVPHDLHRFIIGTKGRGVREMMENFDVNIIIPPQSDNKDTITLKGAPANVESAKAAILEKMDELEKQNQDRILKSYKTIMDVDPEFHPKLIGRKGEVINALRSKYNVQINVPDQKSGSERMISIVGYEKDTEDAKQDILDFIKEQENLTKVEVEIDSRIMSRIIGRKFANMQKMMRDYKVDIRVSKSTESEGGGGDVIVITGGEEGVEEAKDHLLNLEEEYLQDFSERDYMRSFSRPSARNGGHDQDQNEKPGFVVKGAPWDLKKGPAPDTTNQIEFPSFGGAPQAVAAAPMTWGPSRR